MRIAVDGRPLRHPLSGIGVYTHEILSRIAAEHELFVYLDRSPEQPIEFAATLRSGLPRRLTGLATANVRFAQWAKRDKADVFFSPRHHLPLTLADIPAVVTIHDLVWRVAPETMRPLNRLLDTTLMPLALARADRVIAVSNDTAKRIRDCCRRADVVTISNGSRQFPTPVPFAHPKPFFLFVGTKEPRKNLGGTVEGFRRAVAAGLDCDFVLAGTPGWGRSGLDESIADPVFRDRIIDLGPVSPARLSGLYDSCVALVLASIYEGFGIPLTEAMQHGKPVITSNGGAMAEVAGDAAVYVDPGSPTSIARAFVELANNGETRTRLSTNASRRSRSFSWDRAARATVEVLAGASATEPRGIVP